MKMISSIANILQGIKAYGNSANMDLPKTSDLYNDSVKFQNIVAQNINNSYISDDNRIKNPSALGGGVGHIFHKIRNDVKRQETVSKRHLLGEASLVELATATSNASHTVKTMTTLRDEFFKSFEKIMSLQI